MDFPNEVSRHIQRVKCSFHVGGMKSHRNVQLMAVWLQTKLKVQDSNETKLTELGLD